MSPLSIRALVRLACLAASPALGAPLHCPATLDVTQRVTTVPPGSRVFDENPRHVWINAELSDGPPNEQAWLAPDTTRKAGKSFTNVWTLPASAGSPSTGGTWLSCAYSGTSMIVSWRLPNGLKTCEIRYDNSGTPATATAIDCR